jgi:single-stranded DNA-binding protein
LKNRRTRWSLAREKVKASVNKVFISGSVGANPQIAYTPRGQKIVTFPMRVEEGDFSIKVILAGEPAQSAPATTIGRRILVAGMLTKAKTNARDGFTLKASKILPMEE